MHTVIPDNINVYYNFFLSWFGLHQQKVCDSHKETLIENTQFKGCS